MDNEKKSRKQYFKIGLVSFKLGIFFLASAPAVACLFLIFSLFISFLCSKNIFINNWNYPFLICIPLMTLGALFNYQNLLSSPEFNDLPNPYLPLLGLANWIPLFFCFFGFEVYLNSEKKKRDCMVLFLSSTIPLIFSGFGQYWFDWNGPISIFNGLIIWYQRPLGGNSGMTGFFNNPNYTGTWLILIIPFCIREKLENIYSRVFLFASLLCIYISVVITNSRSAWGGMILAFLLMFFRKSKLLLYSFISLSFVILIRFFSIFLNPEGGFLFSSIIPQRILLQFSEAGYQTINPTRIDIWEKTLNLILAKPIFGWGSGVFPFLSEKNLNFWIGHPHNLILELAFSFGLLITIILISTVILILFKSIKFIYSEKNENQNNINKAWLVASLVILISQMLDLQYFDVRISLSIWILLTGLKTINQREVEEY